MHLFTRISRALRGMNAARLSRPPTTHSSFRPSDSEDERPLMLEVDEEKVRPVARPKTTPLPFKQLLVIVVVRITEPICYSLIFPFVNDMIEHVGITKDPQYVGYYSGLVEGTFAFAQFFTVLSWGRLSDRIGRRPVLLTGCFGLIFATILFGFARTFWAMVFARALSGALNGNVAVLKSSLGEITDKTNRARAFSLLPLTWSIGSVLAPIIGGFLARPVDNFPGLFGGFQLFMDFPYLLPCLAGASISLCGVVLGIFFLKETLHSKRKVSMEDKETEAEPASPESPETPVVPMSLVEPEMSIAQILKLPRVRAVLLNLSFLSLTTVSIEAIFVLYLYTPVPAGGLGFNQRQIGLTMSSQAVTSIAVNFLLFPPLTKRLGTTNLYLLCSGIHILVIILFPIIHHFAVVENQAAVFMGIAVMLFLRVSGGLVFPCNMVLVNVVAPSKGTLGTVNGLAQMVSSGARALGPALATTLFALTMTKNLLGGNLIWAFQLTLCIIWMWQGLDLRRHNFDDED
ncbi:MFS general substrate transporter [Exidia glandulosa HHB12029]|uniref:MFS general substrate transporter n=1 Tax=Exidia glandulosa HHB12029 TaxID=1314781 RepID=A0A165BLQ9_EXIGL|nr:MFS general substrate transporter [Exidia glandulosa HHB12029]